MHHCFKCEYDICKRCSYLELWELDKDAPVIKKEKEERELERQQELLQKKDDEEEAKGPETKDDVSNNGSKESHKA